MVTVRKADKGDIGLLMELRVEMLAVVNGVGESGIGEEIRERSLRYFTEGDGVTALAFEGDTPVGCATICFINVMPTFSHPSGVRAHIMNVYTRAEHRRKGAARKMMTLLLDEAKARGASYVSLDATESGRPLYEALGFAPSEESMGLVLS